MSNVQSNIIAVLRAEMAAEAAGEFPRLTRVPCTDIVWFLDYFDTLETSEREALLDGLAEWASLPFFLSGPEAVGELHRRHPAFARWREPRSRMGYQGGTRYTAVKMLNMDPGLRDKGYYHADYRKNCAPLAFEPRADLLPDLSYLRPAKAPLLRKLMNAAMAKLLAPAKKKLPGGECQYSGPLGNDMLKVSVDFGSIMGQVCYRVSVTSPQHTIKFAGLSYEQLWDAPSGWNYLTEENAPRSIEFFAEQVTYLAKLADRVNGL
jgi:hypothetical protein